MEETSGTVNPVTANKLSIENGSQPPASRSFVCAIDTAPPMAAEVVCSWALAAPLLLTKVRRLRRLR